MQELFKIPSFSERDAAIARIIAFISIGEDNSAKIQESIQQLNLSEQDLEDLKANLNRFEEALAAEDESLSDLLANASKSTCCS